MIVSKQQIITKKPVVAEPLTAMNWLVYSWGIAGVAAIVLYALIRLAPYVVEALELGLNGFQWAVMVANGLFMAWSEGYRGFQQKFSPRVAARALYLVRQPVHWSRYLLAPLFCIGYFDANRRLMIFSWVGTTGIVLLVLLVNRFDQPWRGIVDAGVLIGLGWGMISLVSAAVATFRRGAYLISPEVPDSYNDR